MYYTLSKLLACSDILALSQEYFSVFIRPKSIQVCQYTDYCLSLTTANKASKHVRNE